MDKAGCVLIDLKNQKVGLVYRNKAKDYSFPKGHVEAGETLQDCAVRETEEETGRKCHLTSSVEIGTMKYTNFEGQVCVHMYLAVDDGKVDREIADYDKESLIWKDLNEVENCLSYENLKLFWNEIRKDIEVFITKNNI